MPHPRESSLSRRVPRFLRGWVLALLLPKSAVLSSADLGAEARSSRTSPSFGSGECAGSRTEELEAIVASKLKALKRKRGRTSCNATVGWVQQAAVGGGNGGGGGSVGGRPPPPPGKDKQQQHHSKKKDRRPGGGSGNSGGGGGGGDGQPIKRRKGSSSKDDKKSSPQLPAWVTRTPKAGDQVAAKVDDGAFWILATIQKHNEKKGLFIVVDEDAGEDKRREFKLRRSNILSLPRVEEASGAIFPVGSKVMTLYPQTTTFYPATISGPFVEGRGGGGDVCVIQFQDDDLTQEGELPNWRLPARYVRQRI